MLSSSMKILFQLSVLIVYCVLDISGAIKCHCHGLKVCNDDGFMLCEKGTKDCFLLEINNLTILGCHSWKEYQSICASVPGEFNIIRNSNSRHSCCTGHLCNDIFNTNYTLNSLNYTVNYFNYERSTTSNLKSISLSHLDIAFIILVPLIAIGLAAGFLFWVYKRYKIGIFKKRYSGLASNVTVRETVDAASLNTTPRLNEGEIINVASKCVKVEMKAHGRFGCVWLVHLTVPTTGLVREAAAKIFLSQEERSWETELEMYRLPGLKHENVLKLLGADKIGEGLTREAWLVTEYQCHGSVCDFLKTGRLLTYQQMVGVVVGMVKGLAHLHEENPMTGKPTVAHRDFKSRNVLLGHDFRACIADLGLAVKFDAGLCIGDAHLQVGTRRYMAPEVLEGAIQFSRDAFLRIDIYAMGLVMWELMTRCDWLTNSVDCTTTSNTPASCDENLRVVAGPYRSPFEEELGPQPTMDQMQSWVAFKKHRPQSVPLWFKHSGMTLIWETVVECWDQDAEARLSAGCVVERLQSLLNESTDPDEDSWEATHEPDQFPLVTMNV